MVLLNLESVRLTRNKYSLNNLQVFVSIAYVQPLLQTHTGGGMGSRNGALCDDHRALCRVLALPRVVLYSVSKSSGAFWISRDPGGVLKPGKLEW
jgi:hypothetical protein